MRFVTRSNALEVIGPFTRTRAEGNMMANKPYDHTDGWDHLAACDKIMELSDFDEIWQALKLHFKRLLVWRFGKEIITLSRDDERLLAYVKTGEPERQKMALSSLVELRYIYHPEIVEKCVEIIEFGDGIELRWSSARYLGSAAGRKDDDRVISILENCASRLMNSRKSKEDDCILVCINWELDRLAGCSCDHTELDRIGGRCGACNCVSAMQPDSSALPSE